MSPLSPEIYTWVQAVHIVGVLFWTGCLVACVQVLRSVQVTGSSDRNAVSAALMKVALMMDIGATLALITGVILILGRVTSPLKEGWMHGKLFLILILIGLHGFARARLKRYRRGSDVSVPPIVLVVTKVLIVGIVVFAVTKPF